MYVRVQCVTSVISLHTVLFSVNNSEGLTIDAWPIFDNIGPSLQEPAALTVDLPRALIVTTWLR